MRVYTRRTVSMLIIFTLIFSLINGSIVGYADNGDMPGKAVGKAGRASYVEGELLVKFKDGTSSSKKLSFASENGLKQNKAYESVNAGLYSVKKGMNTSKALKELTKNDTIEYIQPNYVYYADSIPDDSHYTKLWGLNNTGQTVNGIKGTANIDIDAPEAWDIARGSEDIVVAVIDTGIDISHPELSERMWRNPGEIPGNGIDDDGNGYIDDIYGWDFHGKDNSVFDSEIHDEHGTHVAGIIAASANNEGVIGVAPGVKIMALKFLGPDGGKTSDAIEAIAYAKEMGVKISNNSWGRVSTGSSGDILLREAIEQSGMLFVASAGNDGANIDSTMYAPSSFPSNNILTVAAVNNLGSLAGFSNYGVNSVDIGAPGVDIYSTIPDVAEGVAMIGMENGYKAFTAAFGLEDLEGQDDARDLLSRVLSGVGNGAPVLLVDDDGNRTVYEDVYEVYSSALTDLNYTNIETVEVASDIADGPSFDHMKAFDAVIWFTGRAFGNYNGIGNWVTTLTNNDQSNLIQYLNTGKRLVLFGQDALYEIEESTLARDYLGLEVAASDYVRNTQIIGTSAAGFQSASYSIPCGPQYERDHLKPAGSKASALLLYAAEQGAFYDYMSGTSMAAPYVAGLSALLLDKNPELTVVQLKSAIMNNGSPLSGLNGKTYTGKMANAYEALKSVAPAKPTNLSALKSGTNVLLTWTGREAGDFKNYVVERKIDSGAYSVISSPESRNYTDSGIDTSKTYSYRVKAVDDQSKASEYSNIAVGNTAASSSSGSSSSTSSGSSSGSGGGGGGGGGSPGVSSSTASNTPGVPEDSDDSKLQDALKNTAAGVNIEVPMTKSNNTEAVEISMKTLDSLNKSGKGVVFAGEDVQITVPPMALLTEETGKYLSSSAKLNIMIREIKGVEAQKLISNTTGLVKVGEKVYDFTAEIKTDKEAIELKEFGRKLRLKIKLAQGDMGSVNGNKLGVYHYNEARKLWEYAGGVYNPQNSTITFDTGHFSKYAVMGMEKSFSDIANHWAKSDIELMVSRHIVDGISSGEFGADKEITRAEVVKMLVNVLRYSPDKNIDLITPKTAAFKDVSADNPDFAFIETAAEHGITKGNPDGTFGPDDTVTREQLTTMIIRAMGIKADSGLSILTFGDKAKIPDWAEESIIAAYERGLVLGVGGNEFGVGSTATRAQGAVIIKRVMDRLGLLQVPAKITGKLVVSSIEGQHYELETNEGVYVLQYDGDNKYLAKVLGSMVGKDLEIGGYEQNVFTTYQRGKVFKVISIEAK